MLELLVTMDDGLTIIAGIPIPSTSPVFLAVVGFHVLLGLICTLVGIVAMLSKKGARKALEFWNNLFLVFIPRFCVLYVIGCCPVAGRLPSLFYWITFICFSVLGPKGDAQSAQFYPTRHRNGDTLYSAFDRLLRRQRQELALLNRFPQIGFWIVPSAIGIPIIAFVLWRHPLIRPPRHNQSKQFVA